MASADRDVLVQCTRRDGIGCKHVAPADVAVLDPVEDRLVEMYATVPAQLAHAAITGIDGDRFLRVRHPDAPGEAVRHFRRLDRRRIVDQMPDHFGRRIDVQRRIGQPDPLGKRRAAFERAERERKQQHRTDGRARWRHDAQHEPAEQAAQRCECEEDRQRHRDADAAFDQQDRGTADEYEQRQPRRDQRLAECPPRRRQQIDRQRAEQQRDQQHERAEHDAAVARAPAEHRQHEQQAHEQAIAGTGGEHPPKVRPRNGRRRGRGFGRQGQSAVAHACRASETASTPHNIHSTSAPAQ